MRTKMDHERYTKIKSLIKANIPDREISRRMKCCTKTLRKIRRGLLTDPKDWKTQREIPPWSYGIDWKIIEKEIEDRHCLSDVWEEKFLKVISYPQFTREFHKQFPKAGKRIITLRDFQPGHQVEVDYAGFQPEWIDEDLNIHKAHIFCSNLCFSQRIFAYGSLSESSEDFLHAHVLMFEYYGGVPRVVVPDNLKTGVNTPHLYDPELNKSYQELLEHYDTVAVPARVRRPQDKSLTENAVKLVTRALRFMYRRETFTSLDQINKALREVCEKINARPHTRFKVSRNEKFQREVKTLKPLPSFPYRWGRWEKKKLHQDCHVSVESNFYSAPFQHRGEYVDVKIGVESVEIYFQKQLLARHKRTKGKLGEYITKNEHLPEPSRAYKEATPQNILIQASMICKELENFIEELFQGGTIENLRRAMGFVSSCHKEIQKEGKEKSFLSLSKPLRTASSGRKGGLDIFSNNSISIKGKK